MSFTDTRVKVIAQENSGVSAARNRGIAESQADLIAFLDADDEWLPAFLATVIGLRDRFPTCDVLATSYYLRSPEGRQSQAVLRGVVSRQTTFVFDDYFSVACHSDPPIWSSAVAVSKRAMEYVGGFPEKVICGEDLLTWARLLVRFKCAYSIRPEAVYYLKPQWNGTSTPPDKGVDVVGEGLAALLEVCEEQARMRLRKYVASWHKARASVYLRCGDWRKALNEVQLGLGYSATMPKLYLYFILCLLPGPICRYIIARSYGRHVWEDVGDSCARE